MGDLGLATAPDAMILQWADQAGFVVVTLDTDFHALLALGDRAKPSVIRIRIEGLSARAQAEVIGEVLESAASEISSGAAVTVTPQKIRIRRLPFSAR